MESKTQDKVSVIIATCNGAEYLVEQLESIYCQTVLPFEVIVCDDLSTDNTVGILEEYKKRFGLKYFINSKRIGVIKNFELAFFKATGDYFVFADQDDIWVPQKIELSMLKMKDLEVKKGLSFPVLIYSDLSMINSSGELICKSRMEYLNMDIKCFSLPRLLMENIANGNTMLINKALGNMSFPIPEGALMHDLWIAMVASVLGVGYGISDSLVRYRIHDSNVMGGTKKGLLSRIGNTLEIIFYNSRRDEFLNDLQVHSRTFLGTYKDKLTIRQIDTLNALIEYKKYNFIKKRIVFIKFGLLKNGLIKNANLLLKL